MCPNVAQLREGRGLTKPSQGAHGPPHKHLPPAAPRGRNRLSPGVFAPSANFRLSSVRRAGVPRERSPEGLWMSPSSARLGSNCVGPGIKEASPAADEAWLFCVFPPGLRLSRSPAGGPRGGAPTAVAASAPASTWLRPPRRWLLRLRPPWCGGHYGGRHHRGPYFFRHRLGMKR